MSYTASYIVNSSSAQGTTDFQFTFPYIKEEHIEVYLNYSKITQGSGSAQYQVITNVSPKLIRLNTGTASANLRVEVRRNSSLGTPLVDYADGSTLTANDLDTSSLQSLYIDQELKDNQSRTVVVDETTGLPELNSQRLTNVADPVNAQDAVTKAYLERTGSITSTQILDGTIVNADVNANAAISGSKLQLASGSNPGALSTSGFVKLGNIETNATADQTDAEIRAAVEAASDSNVFTDADHSKLNAIEASATADQTDAEIRAAVEAATDSNVFTDADHAKLNAIEANATADQTAAEIKSLIATSPLDASHLAANSVGDSEIATGALDNRYYTETELLTDGVLDARYYTESEADARFYNLSSGEEIQSGETWSAADNKIATTAAIDARIIDLVDDVGGFVPIANETSFPAANPDVNNGAGTLVSVKAFASSHTPSGGSVTIANGAGSGNTITITGCGTTVLAAGFGGIVETTSTLHTYTFHRLTPKATEVTTVAGNVTNINTVANNNTNINTVAGNNSNINTVAGISGNVTTVAGISSNVTSVANNSSNINSVNSNSSNINTVAGAISNVNAVGGAIANVNTVATNISGVNDFADRYRVASSDPSSNNDEGDLCFNTTSNELRVYNGSAWQGGVTATGNLAGLGANQFSGNITFTGSQTVDGRDLSVDGAKLDGIEASATADQTAAEIRTLVENAGDSNVFTDADHTKLNGIEANATADQTRADIEGLNITSLGTLSSLNVDGIVSFLGASHSISWIKSTNSLNFADNARLKLGTGSDLQIYHDGSNSFLTNNTGDLKVYTDNFIVNDADNGDHHIKALHDAAVELYYDGSKKFETRPYGARVNGDLQIGEVDGAKVVLGAASDFQIYHDGTHTRLHNTTGFVTFRSDGFQINDEANNETLFKAVNNGAVELYFDNTKRIETTNTGCAITGGLTVSGDLQINGTTTTVNSSTMTVTDKNIEIAKGAGNDAAADGAGITVDSSDGDKTWNWVDATDAWTSSEHIHVPDDKKFIAGTGSDLQINHTGGNSLIVNSTGQLLIRSSTALQLGAPSGEVYLAGVENGAVELYHDNTKRIETTSSGANIVGALTVNGAALSSAPTITATASGTIAANDAVHLNSDGTVRKGALQAAALGSQGTVNSSGSYPKVAFNDAGDTICVVFKGSGNKPYAKAGTISGTTITWGGAVDISPNNDWRFETDAGLAANGSNWVFTWSTENSPWQNKWSMFTVDGTSITYVSTGGVTSDNSDNISLISAGTGTVIMSYNQGAHFRCIKGTISGTSITWGSPMYVGTNIGDRFDIAYDAASQNALCVYVNSGIRAKVLNTGNMTVGSETLVISNGRYYAVTNAGNNIAVVGQVGYQGDLHARICTISGTSQTWGTEYDTGIAHQDNDIPACSYNEEVDQLVFASWNGSDTVMYPLNIGGTNMRTVQSMGSALTVHDNNLGSMVMIYDSVRKQDIIMWSGAGYKIRGPESSTYNSENFIGFSSAGYSNGQTATINVTGNTTTQSSLTPGQKYYIQNDGSLGLTATALNIEAGIALTSTKLLIKG